MDGKTLESKRRAEQYRLYIKFALADVDDLDILEEVYRTVYRLTRVKLEKRQYGDKEEW